VRAAIAGASVEATLKGFLSIRRWRSGELDRGASRCPRDAMRGASAPCLRGYARVPIGLRRGLDGELLASSSSSWRGHPGGSRAAGSGDGTPRRTAIDVTAQGGR
jgi:hypothetical protein